MIRPYDIARILAAACMCLALAACGTGNSGSKKASVQTAEGTIAWNDMTDIVPNLRARVPLAEGEGVFLFTMFNSGVASVTLSNGTRVFDDQGLVDASCTRAWIDVGKPAGFMEECIPKLSRASRAMEATNVSKSKMIRLAEQAIRAHGRCQWVGYDAALDRTARMPGLARLDDDRLFFAKLRC